MHLAVRSPQLYLTSELRLRKESRQVMYDTVVHTIAMR